ncbi:hypothetical protein FCV25MIE_28947 [Fagus crenata]
MTKIGESSGPHENPSTDTIPLSVKPTEGFVTFDSNQPSDLSGLVIRGDEGKGIIVLCDSHDAIIPPSNPIEVNRRWGTSSDWVLELHDGRRLSIPLSIIHQPEVATPGLHGFPFHANFRVMGLMAEDQSSLGCLDISNEDEESEDNISLEWEDLEVVREGN